MFFNKGDFSIRPSRFFPSDISSYELYWHPCLVIVGVPFLTVSGFSFFRFAIIINITKQMKFCLHDIFFNSLCK